MVSAGRGPRTAPLTEPGCYAWVGIDYSGLGGCIAPPEIFPSLATYFTLEPAVSSASLCFLPDTGRETVVSIPQLITANIEAFWDAGFVVVMNSLHAQPKPTDFSSSLLGEHLPPLFFLKACFIEAVPVTNNLPVRDCEHFCQEVKREAGSCQKMKAGVR